MSGDDKGAILPEDYSYEVNGSERGVHSFQLTMKTPGRRTLTVTDNRDKSIKGTASINVISPVKLAPN
jgi:hypothetical protein